MWLVSANQSALFQSRVNMFMTLTSGPNPENNYIIINLHGNYFKHSDWQEILHQPIKMNKKRALCNLLLNINYRFASWYSGD